MKPVQNFDTIYSRGVKGEIRFWRMELGTDESGWWHRVVRGHDGGTEIYDAWTAVEPKNVGRANETTAEGQARAEIASAYQMKLDRQYAPTRDGVDSVAYVKPMLAQDYTKHSHRINWAQTVFSQPKLDGIRCIARSDGLWTRQGKAILSCPHILEGLAPLFDDDPDLVFDGELYNHTLKDDFNRLASLIRKTKVTDESLADSAANVRYYVYDLVEDRTYFSRIAKLFEMELPPTVEVTETSDVYDPEELDRLYGRYLEHGYEGQIVRTDTPYEHKRSFGLLKRKEFQSSEFRVIGVERGKGNWGDAVKRFILDLGDGRTFGAGVRGTMEQLANLEKPDWATVRYFTPTPDGIPRFPVVTDWGFDQRND